MVDTKKRILGCLALAGAISMPVAAQASIVVADDFSTQGRGVAVGDTLSQVAVQQGTGNWTTVNGVMAFTSDGTVGINHYGLASDGAQIAISAPTATETVSLTFTNTTAAWVGVGFQNTASSSFYGLFFAIIDPTGAWSVWVNGSQISYGTASGFVGSDENTLSLAYDSVGQTAELLINGVSAAGYLYANNNPTVGPIAVSLAQSIGSAGFFINTPTDYGAPVATYFEVSAVPEAGSLVVCGAGVLASLYRRRRSF